MKSYIIELKEDFVAVKIGKTSLPIFNKLAWVVTARSKDDLRGNLQKIQVTENYVIATDGKRLHLMETDDLPKMTPGLWDVLKHTKSELIIKLSTDDVTYPNINLLPFYKTSETIEFYNPSQNGYNVSYFTHTVFTKLGNHPYYLRYLEEAKMEDDMLLELNDKNMLVIADKQLTQMAIIMPLMPLNQ